MLGTLPVDRRIQCSGRFWLLAGDETRREFGQMRNEQDDWPPDPAPDALP